MKSTLWFLFPVLGLATAAIAQTPTAPQAKTLNGVVQGAFEEGNVRVFRGIPYAQPPMGELRWREPQPASNWSGVRQANHFGDRPIQPTLWKDMIFRSAKMSEDIPKVMVIDANPHTIGAPGLRRYQFFDTH